MRLLSAASNLVGAQDDAECVAGRLVYTPDESMH